jgi:hypothetical protein
MPDLEPGRAEPQPSPGPGDRQPGLPLAPSDARAPTSTTKRMLPGFVIGVVLYGLLLGFSLASRVEGDNYWSLGVAVLIGGLTVVMLLPAVLLAARQRSRYWGVGLLLAVAVGLFVDSGVCIAVAGP